jgi:hypothetical protein
MYHDYTYEAVLASSLRAQWQLDDVLRADQELDFSRNFMPESLAHTACLKRFTPDEQRALNHISANQYIWFFGAVEEFVLPFVLDHARPMLREDDFRVRALLNFAGEEAKHIHLFKRFHRAFVRGFPVKCTVLGPRDELARRVLSHHPLAVGLLILMIEWMTQEHYVGSMRDNNDIDPLFKSLFKHHWMEEAQHAKLDTLMVDALAEGRSEAEIEQVMKEFFVLLRYIDASLKLQAELNVNAFERAIGRKVENRERLIAQQQQAARWTFVGSGLAHKRFKASLEAISPAAAARVAKVAPMFLPPKSRPKQLQPAG